MYISNLNSLKFWVFFFFQLAVIHLFGCFCLDKLWVDPVGRGDHLWDSLDFFVLLTGEPKQYVLLTVLGLQELPESYLSSWKSQMTVSGLLYNNPICEQSEESLTFTTEDFVYRLTPSLNILQWILGEATQSTLEKSIKIYH